MNIKSSNNLSKSHIVPVYNQKEKINFFNKNKFEKEIKTLLKEFSFKGNSLETKELYIEKQHIILLGLSKEPELEELRKAGNTIYNISKNLEEISVEIPFEKEKQKAFLEGLMLSNYSFDKYFSKKNPCKTTVSILNIESKIIKEIKEITNVVKEVRDLVNENSDITTPEYIEKISKDFAKKHKLPSKILNEKQIEKQGLNLLHAVGKGSDKPPRLIVIEYIGDKSSKEKTALVGKGITFDTGGTNLKPSGFVEDMKLDMGGAAIAYGTFKYLVEQKVKKNLILVLSCAENAISDRAYKPGDVIKSYNGITVEVMNTDAEGRLVLADALSYTQKHFKPTEIIDMATLTGACPVALGPSIIAILGNNKKAISSIFESGEVTGERCWELPIYDEHREMLKSPIADCKNLGGKFGGTITAAAFLEQFIEKNITWTHLDIAGAAWFKAPKNYIPQYATGIGVRLLSNYIINKK